MFKFNEVMNYYSDDVVDDYSLRNGRILGHDYHSNSVGDDAVEITLERVDDITLAHFYGTELEFEGEEVVGIGTYGFSLISGELIW